MARPALWRRFGTPAPVKPSKLSSCGTGNGSRLRPNWSPEPANNPPYFDPQTPVFGVGKPEFAPIELQVRISDTSDIQPEISPKFEASQSTSARAPRGGHCSTTVFGAPPAFAARSICVNGGVQRCAKYIYIELHEREKGRRYGTKSNRRREGRHDTDLGR